MMSRKQLEANKANAKRSTGPRSDAGKTWSRMNALKHGFSSQELLADGGMIDNVPVAAARELGASRVIVVRLHAKWENVRMMRTVTRTADGTTSATHKPSDGDTTVEGYRVYYGDEREGEQVDSRCIIDSRSTKGLVTRQVRE